MERLSDEIVLRIFGYLDTKNVISLRLVNKRFHTISQDPTLYKIFYIGSDMLFTSSTLHSYTSKYHTHIQSLMLQDCFWIPSYKLVNALQRCKQLVELNVTGSKLSSSGLLKILSNNKGIRKLGWSLPSSNISCLSQPTLLNDIQTSFKNLSSIILHFETLNSFEQFLPVFDTKDLYVNEFGLHYLKSSSSNTYGIYVKTTQNFQLYLEDAAVTNRFLHFNLLIMDFVIQTVSKAAETKCITSLLARGNTICWKHISPVLSTYSFEKIDLSLSVLAKDQMAWLSKLTKLTHLNLSHVGQFKANLMKAIASNCSGLRSLNLSCCDDWINKDLYGLEAISKHCTQLKELNLSCLHIHSSNKDLNKLCSIISDMKYLKALSLPACCLVNNVSMNEQEEKTNSRTFSPYPLWRSSSTFKSKVSSNLLISIDSSNVATSSQREGETGSYVTRLSRLISDDQSMLNAIGTGLDPIVKGCTQLEELEIIDTGFHSAFSRVVIDQFICPLTAQLRDKNFTEISQLKNLRKLTLAGLSGVGAFNSLCDITSSCTLLEVLSIAHCGLAGHSNVLASLKSALTHCERLKQFRLDQPHYIVKEDLLESLHHCKTIQSIAFISKNGKAPKEANCYLKLFEECPRLVAFFLFSGTTVSDCKKIQSTVFKRFSKSRAPLCVTVLPYNIALTEEGLKNVPHLYLRDVIQFESNVAVCRPDR